MTDFKNKQVAEKYIAKVDHDPVISMKGFRGNLSKISPFSAKLLAVRNNPYLEAKPEAKAGKKNAEPGGN